MAFKKKRRRKKKKTVPTVFKLAILFFGCLIATWVLLYFLHRSISKVPFAAYEETPTRTSELNAKISKVDHAIYESLYNEKVDEQDIYSSGVTADNAKNDSWEFTELLIKVFDQKAGLRLGAIIQKALSKLKPGVVIKGVSASQREVVYNVFLSGHFTHRIRLVCKESWQVPSRGLPKIAIVIDDIGNDYDLAEGFMKIDLPLTLSVLPSSQYGKDIAEKARKKGFEVILHLPMEPKNYPDVNPGPDALLIKMTEGEIKTIFDRDIDKIPGVRGANNHMGSGFTENQDKMRYVLRELKERDLFYLDSRTTSNSIGFKLAEEMGVPTAKKNVFLDDDLSSKAVKYQIERLFGTARQSGEAIGIGHPHKTTLEVLKDSEGVLKKSFKVVPVSELMK
jgi:uncharacterized protein